MLIFKKFHLLHGCKRIIIIILSIYTLVNSNSQNHIHCFYFILFTIIFFNEKVMKMISLTNNKKDA